MHTRLTAIDTELVKLDSATSLWHRSVKIGQRLDSGAKHSTASVWRVIRSNGAKKKHAAAESAAC